LAWIWSASQALVLPLLVAVVCLLGVAFLAAFNAMIAALLTGLVSPVVYFIRWTFTGTGGSLWFGGLFYWSTAFFFVSITSIITLMVPAWAKRAARASVGRWWRRVEPR
jgi:hypothetical protein